MILDNSSRMQLKGSNCLFSSKAKKKQVWKKTRQMQKKTKKDVF